MKKEKKNPAHLSNPASRTVPHGDMLQQLDGGKLLKGVYWAVVVEVAGEGSQRTS